MSLDVSLTTPKVDKTKLLEAYALLMKNDLTDAAKEIYKLSELEPLEIYSANITHNLGKMAGEAGIYEALWRPEEIDVTRASQLIPLLRAGLEKMKADPDHYKKFNPENGWGSYDGFVPWIQGYLTACEKNPHADISVSR